MMHVPRVGEVGEIPTLTRNRVLDRTLRASESEYLLEVPIHPTVVEVHGSGERSAI